MFMPFYFKGGQPPRVVIAGGGYAGLAALATLREHQPDAEITLIDPRPHHLKITRLHESFRRPLSDLQVPFPALARRFNFRHLQAELPIDESSLAQWNADRALTVAGETLEFDYLLIATGGVFRQFEKGPQTLDLGDFIAQAGSKLLEERLSGERCLTVVGGGATGLQFLFEIAHHFRRHSIPGRLRLVDGEQAPLTQFRPELGRYVESRMADLGIEFLSGQFFRGQAEGQLIVEARDTGETRELPSDLSLLFMGSSPVQRLEANWFGQVVSGGAALARIFTAGDCSQHRQPGSNALSAQTALRKGKLAARNILRHASPVKVLEPYLHRDLGYVISLGPEDSVGWIGLERNVVAGLPASVVKEIVEAQYDLLLAGVDTYIL